MIKKLVFAAILLIALTVSAMAQDSFPDVHVSCDESIMDVGNPSDEQLTIRALWLFWDSSKNPWCDLNLRIAIESKEVKSIRLQDLKRFRNKHQEYPTPRCIGVLLQGKVKGSWYCNYYEMNEQNIYDLNDESSKLLTDTVRKIPGYLLEL